MGKESKKKRENIYVCVCVCVCVCLGASQVVLVIKKPPANAAELRDMSSILGSGRSPGEGHGNPLQYSRLGNPMHKRSLGATVHRVTNS